MIDYQIPMASAKTKFFHSPDCIPDFGIVPASGEQ